MNIKLVNGFGFGPTYNINANNDLNNETSNGILTKDGRKIMWPLVWLEPTSADAVRSDSGSGTFNTLHYSFNVYALDKLKKGEDNLNDAMSDMQLVIQTMIAVIDKHPIYNAIGMNTYGDITWQPVIDETDTSIVGWYAAITLRVDNRLTPCNTPYQPILSYTYSYNETTYSLRLIGPQGPTGPQGATGVGATGSQGNQGPIGPQGATGNQGPQGTQGDLGPQGYQGDIGPQGDQGTQGDQGFQGPTGPQGVQGDFGPVGPVGLLWKGLWSSTATYSLNDAVGYASASWFVFTVSVPPGYVGPTTSGPNIDTTHWAMLAAQGFAGPQGTQGIQGTQGPTGPQGINGILGGTGPQGPQGFQGATGPQGVQGIQGATGPQGPQGDQGTQGPQGVQGIQGVTGPQGFQGATGPQGIQGTQGVQGATGPQGFQGTQGTQGTQGVQGFQGPTGPQGSTGPQGFQGPPQPGPTGSQGPTGPQGATGGITPIFGIYLTYNFY